MSGSGESGCGWMREQGEGEQSLKRLQHRCGYPLWGENLTYLEGVDGQSVVVAYRSASEEASSLPLYGCPQCGKRLRLWWTVEG